jgi:hypothetical protein
MSDEAENKKVGAPPEELAAYIENLINLLSSIGEFAHSPHRFQYTIPAFKELADTTTEENWFELLDRDFDSLSHHEKGLEIRMHVCNVYLTASVQPELLSYKYSATHVMSTYAKDAVFQLQNHNFLLAFTALRGLIETIAHFNNTVSKVDNYFKTEEEPTPTAEDPYDTYRAYLYGLSDLVVTDINGSRYKWNRAAVAKTFLMTEKQRKKKTPGEKTRVLPDPEPISIMTSIDRLDNSVKGCRSAYDLLCEFVHPNSAQRGLYVDLTKTKTIEGIGLPINFYGVKDAGVQEEIAFRWVISTQVIRCIADLGALFLERDKQFKKMLNILKKHTQQYTRQAIKAFQLFAPSDPCPCGSAKTIQSCCGKRLRDHLIDSADRQDFFAPSR